MRFSISVLVAAFFCTTVLAACGGNNTLSASAPLSVAPQVSGLSNPGGSAPRRATSGDKLYVASYGEGSGDNGSVAVYARDSKKLLQTITQGLSQPDALAFDGSGNLYVANATNNTVQVYGLGGSSPMETISEGVYRPDGLAFDSSGNLYVANNFPKSGQRRKEVTCDGELGIWRVTVYAPGSTHLLRTISKGQCFPVALAFDDSGNLYVANQFTPGIPAPSGTVTVYGPGSSKILRTITSSINDPTSVEGGLLFDNSGNLYVDNYGGDDVLVYGPGSKKVLRTISQAIDGPEAMAFDSSGNLYVSNPGNNTVTVYAPGASSPMRTISKGIDGPQGLVFDTSGNLYVTNYINTTVTVYAPGSSSPMLTIKGTEAFPNVLAFGP